VGSLSGRFGAPHKDIRDWIGTWNDDPRPYVWTKTADQILESIKRYYTRINDSRDWVLRFSASRQHQLTV
jgi:hypothetical protein